MESDDDSDQEQSILKSFWIEGDSLAPPCQAEKDVITEILTIAAPLLNESALLVDLGCGDGRICLAATKQFGCRSLGCEIEERLVSKFRAKLDASGLQKSVTVVAGDLRDLDFTEATVLVLYLLPEAVEEIKPKLIIALENNVLLICNTWGPKGFSPIRKVTCGPFNNVDLFVYDRTSLGEFKK